MTAEAMPARYLTGKPLSVVPADDYGFEVYGTDGRWIGWGCDLAHARRRIDQGC